jgi:hypothetical protein
MGQTLSPHALDDEDPQASMSRSVSLRVVPHVVRAPYGSPRQVARGVDDLGRALAWRGGRGRGRLGGGLLPLSVLLAAIDLPGATSYLTRAGVLPGRGRAVSLPSLHTIPSPVRRLLTATRGIGACCNNT